MDEQIYEYENKQDAETCSVHNMRSPVQIHAENEFIQGLNKPKIRRKENNSLDDCLEGTIFYDYQTIDNFDQNVEEEEIKGDTIYLDQNIDTIEHYTVKKESIQYKNYEHVMKCHGYEASQNISEDFTVLKNDDEDDVNDSYKTVEKEEIVDLLNKNEEAVDDVYNDMEHSQKELQSSAISEFQFTF